MSITSNLTAITNSGGLSLKKQLPTETTNTGLTYMRVVKEVFYTDYHVQFGKKSAHT